MEIFLLWNYEQYSPQYWDIYLYLVVRQSMEGLDLISGFILASTSCDNDLNNYLEEGVSAEVRHATYIKIFFTHF